MKRSLWFSLLAAFGMVACNPISKTKSSAQAPPDENTLLWRISGNGLTKYSYLFGTMHMICANDIVISDSLSYAIKNADKVYLEIDMDDMMGIMMSAMNQMGMRGDTTLSDLLTDEEYNKVKSFFELKTGGMMPFSMLEKFKPMLIGSMVMEQLKQCQDMIVMEQMVMEEASKSKKEIEGLETIEYQLAIFDKIPYKVQAKQLLKMIEDHGKESSDTEMMLLTQAYRNQQLDKMDELINKDSGISGYTDILLYDRNENWTNKLQNLMSGNSLVIAVGAGHLPGEKGVINLLRKAGYKVEPVKNDMIIKR